MEYLAFLIPIIVSLVLFLFFRKQTVLWEYLVLLVPTVVIFFILHFTMIQYRTSDTEYIGLYAVEANYYEPWNEYIHKRCTRTKKVGKKTVTTYYDCSYVEYHSAEWSLTLNDKSQLYVSEHTYNTLLQRWNTPQIFVDMHRNYHTNDGDMYYSTWNGDNDDAECITKEQSYENRVKCSESIFNFEDIDESDVAKYKLFEYPSVENYVQNTIIAKHAISDSTMQSWNFMNAYYGLTHKFRCYLFFTYGQPSEFINKQMSYWKGVNKNEICIFVDVDSTTLKRNWVYVKSWSDKPELEIMIRDFITSSDQLDVCQLANYVSSNLDKWNRKDFRDFDYINIELSETQVEWIIIILLIYNICASVWIVKNEFSNNDNRNKLY